MILGMDWLECQNDGKMWINWKKKTMRFKHQDKRITLRGVQHNIDTCTMISASSMHGLLQSGEACQILELHHIEDATTSLDQAVPAEVQAVLQRYQALFEDAKTLPPHRRYQ
jgi:hypothetical protein